MANRIIYFITLIGILIGSSLTAQEKKSLNGSDEKIKGIRFIPYSGYFGSPFLTDRFCPGEIEFMDGNKVENIQLHYSTYRDEIIYFNQAILTQITIDKISLKGFAFTDEIGGKRIFRKQYYNGFSPGDRYFEVLSDGDVSLLAYRKVILELGNAYTNVEGRRLNMTYQPAYNYYFYSREKGYDLIRLNRNSLLSKFDKPTQKLIKKLLRKNDVSFDTEADFVTAWNLIKENGININF